MDKVRFAKLVIFTNGLVPAVLMAWDAAHDRLGANPIEFITRTTGLMTVICLIATLAVTPLRRLTGAGWLVKVRRMLGLFAFFYGSLHLLTYVWLDQFFDVGAIAQDAVSRLFITVGLIAYALMVPLAWTSTQAAVRRMGKKWTELHRYTYHVMALAILHYWLAVKADKTGPIAWGIVAAGLLGWRLWVFLRKRWPERVH